MSVISKKDYSFPINHNSIKEIINEYAKTNIFEIQSELSLFFDNTNKDKLFKNPFNYIANNEVHYIDIINKIEELKMEMDSRDVFTILYNYPLLVLKNQRDEFFLQLQRKYID